MALYMYKLAIKDDEIVKDKNDEYEFLDDYGYAYLFINVYPYTSDPLCDYYYFTNSGKKNHKPLITGRFNLDYKKHFTQGITVGDETVCKSFWYVEDSNAFKAILLAYTTAHIYCSTLQFTKDGKIQRTVPTNVFEELYYKKLTPDKCTTYFDAEAYACYIKAILMEKCPKLPTLAEIEAGHRINGAEDYCYSNIMEKLLNKSVFDYLPLFIMSNRGFGGKLPTVSEAAKFRKDGWLSNKSSKTRLFCTPINTYSNDEYLDRKNYDILFDRKSLVELDLETLNSQGLFEMKQIKHESFDEYYNFIDGTSDKNSESYGKDMWSLLSSYNKKLISKRAVFSYAASLYNDEDKFLSSLYIKLSSK